MAINVGCEFRGRGSIPNVCQTTDADLGQVSHGGLLLDQQCAIEEVSIQYIIPSLYIIKENKYTTDHYYELGGI